jgi:hypothetical protein
VSASGTFLPLAAIDVHVQWPIPAGVSADTIRLELMRSGRVLTGTQERVAQLTPGHLLAGLRRRYRSTANRAQSMARTQRQAWSMTALCMLNSPGVSPRPHRPTPPPK